MSVTHWAAKTHCKSQNLYDLLMIDTFSGCMRVVMETLCCDIKLHGVQKVNSPVSAIVHLHYSISTHQMGHNMHFPHNCFTFTLILSTSLSPIKRAVIIYTHNKYIFIGTHIQIENRKVLSFNAVCINLEYFIIFTLSLHESM